MHGVKGAFFAILFLATQIRNGFSFPVTAPSFLWSSHHHGSSEDGVNEPVYYHTISPKELAKSVLSEGGWSKFLCSGKKIQQNVDVALIFVGRKLHSLDISRNKHVDSALIDLLKLSFTSSNHSMAFPYVAVSDAKKTLENSLISGFTESCERGLGVAHVSYLESCFVDGEDLKKLADLRSVHDYLGSRMETRIEGQTDLIVLCHGGLDEIGHIQSEGETLSKLVSSLEQSGVKYTILYASDPHGSLQYPSYRAFDRFLAEDSGNGSDKSTGCDGVCQIKSSLLEGLFVGIVLLIILISGLCCMMGIDTPTRFETPQDS